MSFATKLLPFTLAASVLAGCGKKEAPPVQPTAEQQSTNTQQPIAPPIAPNAILIDKGQYRYGTVFNVPNPNDSTVQCVVVVSSLGATAIACPPKAMEPK